MQTCQIGLSLGLAAALLAVGVRAQESPMGDIKQAAASAKVTLVQALEAGQKEAPDGKVVEVALQWDKTPATFVVQILTGDKVKQIRIDATSGTVLDKTEAKLGEEHEKGLGPVRQALSAAKIMLPAAIDAATRELKGSQALQAELQFEENRPAYAIRVLQGDKLMAAVVDAVSGQVTKAEEQFLPLALWTFDKTAAGQAPAGLLARETHPSGTPGEWKVTADPGAPTSPNVLTLTTSAPDATFNVGLFEKTAYKDVDIRVRIRANSGKEDQGGGLIWRAKDENNYYICRINPLENNFRVYKVVDGQRRQLQSVEFKAETGRWHQVRAVMVGNHITCYADGTLLLDTTDDTLADAGMIGLWTKADASSSFDNLAVFAPRGDTKSVPSAVGKKPAPREDDDDDD